MKEILTPETLEFIANKKQMSIEEENNLVNLFNNIIQEIEKAIINKENPRSAIGSIYGKKWMKIVEIMGKGEEDKKFGIEVWDAYKKGLIEDFQNKFPNQKFFINIPKKVIQFLDEAISYMFEQHK